MRTPSSQQVVCLVALAASACSSQPNTPRFVEVADSAGIRIVTNSDPVWQDRVFATLPDSPDLVVGMREGPSEYIFSRIVSAKRSDSGRLTVADGASGEIRVFNEAGRLLTRFGGKGSGPGEFRSISSVQSVSGDSTVVWDYGAGRLSVFGSDGELASDFDLHERRPRGVGWVGPGRYLLKVSTTTPTMPSGTESTVIRDTVRFEAWSPDGDVSPFADDLYPAVESALLARVVEGKVRFAEAPRLFGRDVHAAFSSERIALGSSDRFSIDVFDVTGTPIHTLRMPGVERPATQQDVDRWMEATLEQAGDTPGTRAALDLMANSAPLPTLMPAFADLLLDGDQNLWVQEFTAPGATEIRWLVFDRDGAFQGVVRVPIELRITYVGRGEAIGVWKDELDVESVRVFAISPNGTR